MRPFLDGYIRACLAIISIHASHAGCDPCFDSYMLTSLYFNPRIPCGMRLVYLPCRLLPVCISIHASHAGCDDYLHRLYKNHSIYFNPRIPCKMRLQIRICWLCSFSNFNPRIPCGMRPAVSFFSCTSHFCISIHASHAGCDLHFLPPCNVFPISIHASHAGCDNFPQQQTADIFYFNPRNPCGMRQQRRLVFSSFSYFNSRIPCGMRLKMVYPRQTQPYFNPRIPCGMRLYSVFNARNDATISIHASHAGCDFTWDGNGYNRERDFNPRIPCGMQPVLWVSSLCDNDFNPRIPCGMRRIHTTKR